MTSAGLSKMSRNTFDNRFLISSGFIRAPSTRRCPQVRRPRTVGLDLELPPRGALVVLAGLGVAELLIELADHRVLRGRDVFADQPPKAPRPRPFGEVVHDVALEAAADHTTAHQ